MHFEIVFHYYYYHTIFFSVKMARYVGEQGEYFTYNFFTSTQFYYAIITTPVGIFYVYTKRLMT